MTSTCQLEHIGSRSTPCPEGRCPLWEPDGAVLEGRCAFELLDLARCPEIAAELLRVRRLLESAVSEEEGRYARHLFHRVLNESVDE
jgi:hypothetical protein